MRKLSLLFCSVFFCSCVTMADEVLTLEEKIVALTILGSQAEGEQQMNLMALIIQQTAKEREKKPATVCLHPRRFPFWNGVGIKQATTNWFPFPATKDSMYARKLGRKVVAGEKIDDNSTVSLNDAALIFIKIYGTRKEKIR